MGGCKWKYDGEPYFKWDTGCGSAYFINGDGHTPNDLGYYYCPNCGGRIENVKGVDNKTEGSGDDGDT